MKDRKALQSNKSNQIIGIQYLRAFAILLVLSFHSKLLLPNVGYLGVDIFFIISGFLMFLLYGQTQSQISAWQFYAKRIRRLLPAFYVSIFITAFFISINVEVFEFTEFLKALPSNFLFISNFSYWLQEQYFATESFRPLLNSWSLSVEVQFYLIFPIINYLLRKSKPARAIVLGIMFASFLTYCILSFISPQTAFFLMPFRLWQFGIGIFLADYLSRSRCKVSNRKNFGRALLFFLFFFLIASDKLATRSTIIDLFNLCVVSFCTSLYLLITFARSSHIKISRIGLLVGNYSYAIYLYHFPILIILNYIPFHGNLLGAENLNVFLKNLFALMYLVVI